VMKWIVRVNRFRFIPPGRCRIVDTQGYTDRFPDSDLDLVGDGEGDN
jgi:hypothetical protein